MFNHSLLENILYRGMAYFRPSGWTPVALSGLNIYHKTIHCNKEPNINYLDVRGEARSEGAFAGSANQVSRDLSLLEFSFKQLYQ
jgi:hypothetical protein